MRDHIYLAKKNTSEKIQHKKANIMDVNQLKNETQNKAIYSDDNYKKLIAIANEIKEKTKIENEDENYKSGKNLIWREINSIGDTYGYKPSYGMFINKIINDNNLNTAKEKIIKNMEEKNIHGYSPDIRVIINEIMTEENIKKAAKEIAEKIKLLSEI